MNETGQRMLDGSKEPNARQIAAWLGPVNYKRWKNILQFIETNYPGVFAPDSLRSQFGGKKYGWELRLKVQVFLHADPRAKSVKDPNRVRRRRTRKSESDTARVGLARPRGLRRGDHLSRWQVAWVGRG